MSPAKPLTDKEYAECFKAFKTVSAEWIAMSQWLDRKFLPLMARRDSAKVLSIGSGTGDFDLTLIRLAQQGDPQYELHSSGPQLGA
jgi:hypothetical protein